MAKSRSPKVKTAPPAGPKKAQIATVAATTAGHPSLETQLFPPPGGIAVRMYRQGLGDCFLLAFATSDPAKPYYLLIDCGVHARQDQGPDRLRLVMENLVVATGGALNAVAVTHEHADHLSGFVIKGNPFLNGRLTVNQFWAAWTENPEDTKAEVLREKRGKARAVIQAAVDKLRQKGAPGLDQAVEGLLDFEKVDPAELSQEAARRVAASVAPIPTAGLGMAAADAKAPRASANEVAIALLREQAEKTAKAAGNPQPAIYGTPGQVFTLPDVKDLHVHVLGPPREREDLLKKDSPSGQKGDARHEVYLAGRLSNVGFALAPALHDGDRTDDARHPFEATYRRPYTTAKGRPVLPGGLNPSTTEALRLYFDGPHSWRRIETDWLNAAESLALNLDSDTNNTSLVLAFEWGPPGKRDVLLFVGDAQVGNWLSWRKQDYTVDGVTVKADDLLRRTLLYKVGHHGSHNATVRLDSEAPLPDGRGFEPFGLELMPDKRMIALVPVDKAAVDKNMPKPWEMPWPDLYKRLLEKAEGRVIRSDGLGHPFDLARYRFEAPTTTALTPVPDSPGVEWRESPTHFPKGPTANGKRPGRECPLYYDLAFSPPPP